MSAWLVSVFIEVSQLERVLDSVIIAWRRHLQNPRCEFLSADDQKVTVHIHWIDSHLLTTPTYHSLDDVSRLHKHQMMREILALQSENYALEKQLYSYQKSIARTHSRGQSESEDYPPDRNHYHR
eukprot:XP_011426896.1 PREDICTED: uncharacterized protein LOC105327916 [Crassostrea gigas]